MAKDFKFAAGREKTRGRHFDIYGRKGWNAGNVPEIGAEVAQRVAAVEEMRAGTKNRQA
jgi:hypothetical protein